MKQYILYTIFGVLLIVASFAVHAQVPNANNPPVATFFHALNDVPVMPGMRELVDESLNFDKPEGRIISVTAVSDTLAPAAIKNFYQEALPQLGWKAESAGVFFRENERLSLIVEQKEGVSIARLQISPR